MSVIKQLHNSVKYPTSIIVKGANLLGVEIAKSLLEQGGYVVIIDSESNASRKLLEPLAKYKNLTVLDFTVVTNLAKDLRRLDYVFYFEHKSTELAEKISTQKFLQNSNYLDSMLDLTAKFDAKFLLTTSLKAHQLNISNAQFNHNYGLKSVSKHTEYIELEIQRYAESLVKEYQEKVNINARVLRVGEIIGRGIEFDQTSSLINLIKQGLNADDLEVPGDGLEASYYIHYLDAAYGVLKAQFSASSKGRIFTLSNLEEITILSIAYKLLEILPEAREIKFSPDDDKSSPLVLYKPAENLSAIGWNPRITFERALVQTVEYIQELLIIEEELRRVKAIKLSDGKNTGEKIRDFFFVAENELDESDAINKLINERKKLDMVRTGAMVAAIDELKDEKSKNEKLNIIQKVDLFLHDSIFGLSRKVSFLKNVTVWDLLVTLLFVFGFAVIFLILISPLFSLSRNIFEVNSNFEKVSNDVKQLNFKQAREHNIALSNNLSLAQERVEDLHYLYSLLNKDEEYMNTQRFLESAVEYSQAHNDLLYAYEPFQEYLENSNLNITYRFGEGNLLTSPAVDSKAGSLQRISNNRAIVADSLSRISKSGNEIDIYSKELPGRFQNLLKADRGRLEENITRFSFVAEYYPYWPQLLGHQEPIRYLIVVQDNTRFNSAGGDVVGYIDYTLDEGAVSSLNTHIVRNNEVDARALTDRALEDLNLISTREINRENVTFSDLGLIKDRELFLQTIERNFELTNDKRIDLAVSVNLSTLASYFQSSGEVEYQQITFSDENLLNGIDLISDDKQAERNMTIMNLYAKSLADSFSSLEISLEDLSGVMGLANGREDMYYYSGRVELENFIRKANGVEINPTEEISFGMNSDFSLGEEIKTYPITTLNGSFVVNKDYSTNKRLEMSLNSSTNLESSYICFGSGARNIQNIGVDESLVSSAFSERELCKIYLKDGDNKYGVQYQSGSFTKQESSQSVYVLRLKKNPGIESNYDLEFEFNGFNVVPEDENYILQNGVYIYSGILDHDKIFKFELTK